MGDEPVTIPFARSELATVIAALRHWQQVVRETDVDGVSVQQIPFNLELHFIVDAPLSHAEIDDLCQRLMRRR